MSQKQKKTLGSSKEQQETEDTKGIKRKNSTSQNAKEKKPKKEMISSEEFLKEAKPLQIKIGDTEFTANPQSFKTGSFGWSLAGKTLKVSIGENDFTVQISVNLPVRGSKPQKEGVEEEEE